MIAKNLEITTSFDGKRKLTVELGNKNDIKALQDFIGMDLLDIKVSKHRKKRSLTANATLWLLLDRLADKLETTKDELYLQFLEQYGTFTHMIIKPDAVDYFKREWRTVRVIGKKYVNGQEGVQLQCYYGSSAMNTKEFSRLLTGVIHECETQGIETITDSEFEKLLLSFEKERANV